MTSTRLTIYRVHRATPLLGNDGAALIVLDIGQEFPGRRESPRYVEWLRDGERVGRVLRRDVRPLITARAVGG